MRDALGCLGFSFMYFIVFSILAGCVGELAFGSGSTGYKALTMLALLLSLYLGYRASIGKKEKDVSSED